VIVAISERAIVVRDIRISRRPGIFRIGPVSSLFGCYSISILSGCASAIVCYLAEEIFNISQCGLCDMTERSSHVTRIGMALYALQDTVDVGLGGGIVVCGLALENLTLYETMLSRIRLGAKVDEGYVISALPGLQGNGPSVDSGLEEGTRLRQVFGPEVLGDVCWRPCVTGQKRVAWPCAVRAGQDSW
jgi:hypothetical protein